MITKFITARDLAGQWDVNQSRIRQLLKEKRIEGAFKMAGVWLIPRNVKDPRKPTGKPLQK